MQKETEPVGREDKYKLREKALMAIWQPKEYWRDRGGMIMNGNCFSRH